MDKESLKRNQKERVIAEEGIWEAYGKHLGGIWQASGRHLEGIWEASGRHLGGTWEASETPGGHGAPGGSESQKSMPLSAIITFFMKKYQKVLSF